MRSLPALVLLLFPFWLLAQNIGIGTAIPNSSALLHIDLGASSKGFLVTGTYAPPNDIANLPPGARLLFYPGKTVFRVGNVSGTQWDDDNSGYISSAMGYNTIASGFVSTAFGTNTTAMGNSSTAIGDGTKASGFASTSTGGNSSALGAYSFTTGYRTIAKGYATSVTGVFNDSVLLTNTPGITSSTPLFIVGNGDADNSRSNAFLIRKDGKIGIGNSNPGYLLDVNDRIRIRAGAGASSPGIYLNKSDNSVEAGFMGMQNDANMGFYGVPLNAWGLVMNTTSGNVGIGTTTPVEKLAVLNTSTGTSAAFSNTNTSNNATAVNIFQSGIGKGLLVQLLNPSNGSSAIEITQNGIGSGILSNCVSGVAVRGITASVSAAGVIGDNTTGEAVVGRCKGGNGVGAVVGRNDSSGYGVRGFCTKNGIGVLGQGGVSGGTGIAGKFEIVNAANSSNALEGRTTGTGAAGYFTNTSTGPALVTDKGNVGIGITNPAFPLDVTGRMRIRSGGSGVTSPGIWLNNIENTADIGFFGVFDNTHYGWYGSGGASWNLLMDVTNGNIGIGLQNPSQKLHVNGNICYTGSIAACSDIRYKKNINPLGNTLEQVMKMHAIYYNWDKEKFTDKSFNDDRQLGFSAQEIKALYPEIVQTDMEGYLAVDYSRLTPVLVEAIKEQQKQIKFQEQQLMQVKTENQNLEKRLAQLEKIFMKE